MINFNFAFKLYIARSKKRGKMEGKIHCIVYNVILCIFIGFFMLSNTQKRVAKFVSLFSQYLSINNVIYNI